MVERAAAGRATGPAARGLRAGTSHADCAGGLAAYLRWLRRDDDPARRLCDAGEIGVGGEKGDGGLTEHERTVLEACPAVRLVTVPGQVFFLPNEVPEQIADVISASTRIEREKMRHRSAHSHDQQPE